MKLDQKALCEGMSRVFGELSEEYISGYFTSVVDGADMDLDNFVMHRGFDLDGTSSGISYEGKTRLFSSLDLCLEV